MPDQAGQLIQPFAALIPYLYRGAALYLRF